MLKIGLGHEAAQLLPKMCLQVLGCECTCTVLQHPRFGSMPALVEMMRSICAVKLLCPCSDLLPETYSYADSQ